MCVCVCINSGVVFLPEGERFKDDVLGGTNGSDRILQHTGRARLTAVDQWGVSLQPLIPSTK